MSDLLVPSSVTAALPQKHFLPKQDTLFKLTWIGSPVRVADVVDGALQDRDFASLGITHLDAVLVCFDRTVTGRRGIKCDAHRNPLIFGIGQEIGPVHRKDLLSALEAFPAFFFFLQKSEIKAKVILG